MFAGDLDLVRPAGRESGASHRLKVFAKAHFDCSQVVVFTNDIDVFSG
jgi:hypothetical protein